MPSLTIIDRSGGKRIVHADSGPSIMELIRGEGYDELVALCGGCLSCATCHVYLDPVAEGQAPAMTQDEDDLLDSLLSRQDSSRLSCQVPFSAALDGAVVTIAPEE